MKAVIYTVKAEVGYAMMVLREEMRKAGNKVLAGWLLWA